MPNRLQDKVAIITGASTGIGRAIALAYHAEGATVVCSDLREDSRYQDSDEKNSATHALIQQQGGKSHFIKADVSKAEDVEALVKETVEKFGRLDIMVNNAGISVEVTAGQVPIWEVAIENFDKTIAVNTRGVFLGIKYASAQMIKQEPSASGDRGNIISLASVMGLVSSRNASSYVASKHAVVGLTKAAAIDCAPHRVHVNALCPGFIDDTALLGGVLKHPQYGPAIEALHPFRGVGHPSDIAKAAVFLASDDNSWITGVGLPVDGGYTAL